MKIIDLLEAKIMDPDEYNYELSSRAISTIAKRTVASMYPTATVVIKSDMYGDGSTTIKVELPDSGDGLRAKSGYWILGVTGAEGIITIYIEEAYSNIKGINRALISNLFNSAERSWGTPKEKNISMRIDASHGYWAQLATQLGATFEAEITK